MQEGVELEVEEAWAVAVRSLRHGGVRGRLRVGVRVGCGGGKRRVPCVRARVLPGCFSPVPHLLLGRACRINPVDGGVLSADGHHHHHHQPEVLLQAAITVVSVGTSAGRPRSRWDPEILCSSRIHPLGILSALCT